MAEQSPQPSEERTDDEEATGPDAPAPVLPLLQRIPPVPFAVLSLAVVFILYQVVGGVITLLIFSAKITVENVEAVRWATLIGQVLFILVPTIVLARLRYPGVKGFFNVRIPDYKEVVLSIIAVFALQQLLQVYMIMQSAIPLPAKVEEFLDMFKRLIEETYNLLVTANSPGEFIVVVLVVALTPAICEELFFRGLIQHAFEEARVGLQGAVLTGIIFAVYHVNPFTLVPLAALGSYFGFLVYRSQNISVAMSAHFFNNFVACMAIYMRLDDDFVAVAPGGEITPSLLLLNFLLFGLVFVGATYYFIHVTSPSPETPGSGS